MEDGGSSSIMISSPSVSSVAFGSCTTFVPLRLLVQVHPVLPCNVLTLVGSAALRLLRRPCWLSGPRTPQTTLQHRMLKARLIVLSKKFVPPSCTKCWCGHRPPWICWSRTSEKHREANYMWEVDLYDLIGAFGTQKGK